MYCPICGDREVTEIGRLYRLKNKEALFVVYCPNPSCLAREIEIRVNTRGERFPDE